MAARSNRNIITKLYICCYARKSPFTPHVIATYHAMGLFTIDENWMRNERVHNGRWTRLDSHVPAHVLMQLQPPYCCYYRPARTWDHLQSIQQHALFEHTYDTLFMTSTIAHTIRFTFNSHREAGSMCTCEHNQFASIHIARASNVNNYKVNFKQARISNGRLEVETRCTNLWCCRLFMFRETNLIDLLQYLSLGESGNLVK